MLEEYIYKMHREFIMILCFSVRKLLDFIGLNKSKKTARGIYLKVTSIKN